MALEIERSAMAQTGMGTADAWLPGMDRRILVPTLGFEPRAY